VASRRRRSLILVLAALCLGGAIVIAVLVSRDTTPTPTDLASSKTHHHPQRAAGVKVCKTGSRVHTVPAALLGRHASNIPTQALIPVNAWSAADCHRSTWVYAGGAGWRDGTGIFVITRTQGEQHELPTSYIVLPGSGTTRITHAPLGPRVVTGAQRHGEFKFKSRRGIKGTISLSDDTATLSTGEVIQARNRPYPQY
jgi:hypothetical protein